MKIIITGGAGFLGSNFIRYLINKYPNYKILNIDKLTYAGNLENLRDIEKHKNYHFIHGDICDAKMIKQIFPGTKAIVNFAAESSVELSMVKPSNFITSNICGTFSLLEASRESRINRFIQISSDEVYGEACSPEGCNRPSSETDPFMPKSPYAASKAAADRLVYAYFSAYKVPAVIVRCSNIFGPYQHTEKVIPLFITNALEEKELPIHGDGKSIREWTPVNDLCRVIDLTLHTPSIEGQAFNIGSGIEKNINEIASMILTLTGKPNTLIRYVNQRQSVVRRHAVSAKK